MLKYRDDSNWKAGTAKAYIKDFESGNADFSLHNDGKNIPTLGYGYALLTQVDGVWQIRSGVESDLKSAGLSGIAPSIEQTLQNIADEKNAGNESKAEKITDDLVSKNPWNVYESNADTLLDFTLDEAESNLEIALENVR